MKNLINEAYTTIELLCTFCVEHDNTLSIELLTYLQQKMSGLLLYIFDRSNFVQNLEGFIKITETELNDSVS